MIYNPPRSVTSDLRWRHVAVAGLSVALIVAFFLSPLASAAPDGLEHVTGEPAGAEVAATLPAPMADYLIPGLGGIWLATSLAGVVGSLIVFALAWALARGLRQHLVESASS